MLVSNNICRLSAPLCNTHKNHLVSVKIIIPLLINDEKCGLLQKIFHDFFCILSFAQNTVQKFVGIYKTKSALNRNNLYIVLQSSKKQKAAGVKSCGFFWKYSLINDDLPYGMNWLHNELQTVFPRFSTCESVSLYHQ